MYICKTQCFLAVFCSLANGPLRSSKSFSWCRTITDYSDPCCFPSLGMSRETMFVGRAGQDWWVRVKETWKVISCKMCVGVMDTLWLQHGQFAHTLLIVLSCRLEPVNVWQQCSYARMHIEVFETCTPIQQIWLHYVYAYVYTMMLHISKDICLDW